MYIHKQWINSTLWLMPALSAYEFEITFCIYF
uniref:Uncharacterized protein n=1 Tax=Anguilla anguilla TaxID=7936 RepID=A0A0E9PRB1_ANGAN